MRRLIGNPRFSIVNVRLYLAGCVTFVTGSVAAVVVDVILYLTRCAADVTVNVTSVVIFVKSYGTLFPAFVTRRIASVSVSMICRTCRVTNITRLIAVVGIDVILGSARSAADITRLIARIIVYVILGSARSAADVAVSVSVVSIAMSAYRARCAADVASGIASVSVGVSGEIALLILVLTGCRVPMALCVIRPFGCVFVVVKSYRQHDSAGSTYDQSCRGRDADSLMGLHRSPCLLGNGLGLKPKLVKELFHFHVDSPLNIYNITKTIRH